MNPFPYAMFIFVKMQNCVKWHMDRCFPVHNTQNQMPFYSSVTNVEGRRSRFTIQQG